MLWLVETPYLGSFLDGSTTKARPAPKAVRRSCGAFRGEEKGENAVARRDNLFGVIPGRLHYKSETRAQSSASLLWGL
ncbi:hypothetical protein J31TS6_35360 [Brevibacillus reuszeri]|nr:hypothetical protein J31TS6_35360 [Brevibacillus reuszeri]